VIGVAATRPSDAEAVAILVAMIRHPDHTFDQLCQHLKRQGLKVDAQLISNLLAYHGLEQKKTPPSR
jgi:hypothetical protein